MKVVYEVKSTNGRWGLQIMGANDVELPERGLVFRNFTVKDYGTTAHMWVLELVSADGFFTIVTGEAKCITGCTLVAEQNLQSSNEVSVIVARPGAIFKEIGYKGRSSQYITIDSEGKKVPTPVGMLVAAGLVEPEIKDPEPIIPEEIPGTMLDAFKKAFAKKEGMI